MNKKIISILLVTVMILSSMVTGVFADSNKIIFTDVDATSEEGAAIYKLAENGIVSGHGDGTFAPLDPVTRAELCKMMNNIWNFTEPANEGFKDVTEDHWYFTHVLIAKKAGYINGFEDGTFRGDSYVTREQACAMISRIAALTDVLYNEKIADEVSDWAQEDVNKILANGLMSLENGNIFRATDNMKRGELAKVLSNFVDVEEDKKPESDDKNTNETTGGSTGSGTGGGTGGCTGGGIGGGTGGGTIQPAPDYTSQNASVVSNLTTAKTELTTNRELFTEPEKQIIDIVLGVLNNLISDQSKYLITTESVYLEYSDKILEALSKYSQFDASGRSSFVSKISQLNSQVFNFLETFFGVDFSDIENELQ